MNGSRVFSEEVGRRRERRERERGKREKDIRRGERNRRRGVGASGGGRRGRVEATMGEDSGSQEPSMPDIG